MLLIWLAGNISSPLPAAGNKTACEKIYRERLNSGYYNTKYYDGYAWNSISEPDKFMYINALWVGLDMGGNIITKNSSRNNPVQKQFLFFKNRIIKNVGWYLNSWRLSLNQFYRLPKNNNVTVYSAIYQIAGLKEKK